mgnify:CR=1 FL=1
MELILTSFTPVGGLTGGGNTPEEGDGGAGSPFHHEDRDDEADLQCRNQGGGDGAIMTQHLLKPPKH